ncbi:hypothetical protein MMC09_006904 [Bachmanniomyces sp. S44760]|nr:hypothetical protein [Bachmanniomyces sp. S44760]
MQASPQCLFSRTSSAIFSSTTPKASQSFRKPRLSPPVTIGGTLNARPFVSEALTPSLQTLTASRTLAYPASSLYRIIADIDAYPQFIPYCTSSTVTKWSRKEAKSGKSWPQEAELRVGWAGYDEVFKSKVYCVPERTVEAVAGGARTSLAKEDIRHHLDSEESVDKVAGNDMIKHLLTRWTLREFPFKPLPPDGKSPQEGNASEPPKPQTEVNLMIEIQFANAVYAALSNAAASKVASIMVEAFEKRALEVLGGDHGGPGSNQPDGALEGHLRGPGLKASP